MATTRRAARLVDVAEAAGVHTSTVSRVLNADPKVLVRPETAKRIYDAARRVGYRPNVLARSLRGSRAGAIGMVVPLLRNPIWTRLQAGAIRRAEKHGYVVMMLEQSTEASAFPVDYRYLVDESRVDGLLLATALRTDPRRSSDPGVPHVFVNRRGSRPGHNVVMDEDEAMRLVVERAAALGHRSLGLIDGPRAVDTVHRRVQATRRLCAARGLTLRVVNADATEEGGADAARRLFASGRHPSFCAVGSLNQVFGLTAQLRTWGVNIPGRVSVVSLDEDECLAYLDVAVTSVSMPLQELGAVAVEALLRVIDGEPTADVVLREPIVLIERDSVGAADRPASKAR